MLARQCKRACFCLCGPRNSSRCLCRISTIGCSRFLRRTVVCETWNRLPEPDPENCCVVLSSLLSSSSSSSAAADQSDDDDAFDRFGPLHAPICGTAYLINLHTAAPCLVGGGPSGSRSARARSRAHLSSPRPVLLSESKAPRKRCAWPRSMDFPTARPIVVEEMSKGNI